MALRAPQDFELSQEVCAAAAPVCRYASVDESGRYSSPIPTVSGRFGTMVGGLTMGRILIAQVRRDRCVCIFFQSFFQSCSNLRMNVGSGWDLVPVHPYSYMSGFVLAALSYAQWLSVVHAAMLEMLPQDPPNVPSLTPTAPLLVRQGAVSACMIGTAIAIHYSAQRPQFGDKLIMDYLSHQRRLLPGLAATYALHLGLKQLKVRWFVGRTVCSTSGGERHRNLQGVGGGHSTSCTSAAHTAAYECVTYAHIVACC